MPPGLEVGVSAPPQSRKEKMPDVPIEIQSIIETTVKFVAQMGEQFEGKIRERQRKNPKFEFLDAGHPYRPYYQQKLDEAIESTLTPEQRAERQKERERQEELRRQKEALEKRRKQALEIAAARKTLIDELATDLRNHKLPRRDMIVEPPADPFSIVVPEHSNLSPLDLDIIKHTAQFVAKNGRNFLAGLMNREQRNPQFDFLKPINPIFPIFQQVSFLFVSFFIKKQACRCLCGCSRPSS
jgi:splicing factor 3A subunit 1